MIARAASRGRCADTARCRTPGTAGLVAGRAEFT